MSSKYIGIAISGKMCSGKTTLARALAQELNLEVASFATTLKDSVVKGLMYAVPELPSHRLPDDKDILRPLYQHWGDVVRHYLGNEYFITRLFSEHQNPVVIDDLRFKSEYNALKRMQFLMVRLNVSSGLQLDRLVQLYPNTRASDLFHPSETELDNESWDIQTINIDELSSLKFISEIKALWNR